MICRGNLHSSNNNTNQLRAILSNVSLRWSKLIQKQQEKEKEAKEASEKNKRGDNLGGRASRAASSQERRPRTVE
jgi:hypothetical protein